MIDYYLRAGSREALDAVLEAAGLKLGEHTLISRIGSVTRVSGYEGGEPIMQTDDRYHLNLRLLFKLEPEQIDALATVIINPPPGIPFRIWA